MPGSLRHIPTRDSASSVQAPNQSTIYRHDDAEAATGHEASPAGTLDGGSSPAEKEKADKEFGSGEKAEVRSVHTEGSVDQQQYRTMSWQRTCFLLCAEYVCLAILAFPSAFAVLGMAGGILCTIGIGLMNLYTSLKLHAYCMKHPQLLHIADIGRQLFGGHWIAYELTALALVLNNW